MLAFVATLVVALAHVAFMVVETFLWTTPAVRERFGQSAEEAAATAVLAKNQGVYNGALAVALAWAAIAGATQTQAVLLVFVVVVGIYGGATTKGSIFFVQAFPAAIALGLTLLGL